MTKTFATAFATLALTAAAHAGTVVFDFPTSTIEYATGVTLHNSTPFSSPSTSGLLVFTLDGYNTLDGQNFYEDDFTLTVNGAKILVGTFNLGGGGNNVVYSAPTGTVITGYNTNPNSVTDAGGALTFTVPVTLLGTGNDIDWGYVSLADASHAGFQGTGDEGWGLSNITVTAVPEPGSIALMLAGLGIVGGLARRRVARQA
jgi:hypothetical protein